MTAQTRLVNLVTLTTLLAAFAATARAEPEFTLVLESHRFTPAELVVPAAQKLKLIVENRDPTPEEFESYALNREKIVPPGTRAVLWVGPLKPGRYEFFGDFNPATARGVVVVRP